MNIQVLKKFFNLLRQLNPSSRVTFAFGKDFVSFSPYSFVFYQDNPCFSERVSFGRKITLEYGLKKAFPKIEEYFSKAQVIDHIRIEENISNNPIDMSVKFNKEEIWNFTNKMAAKIFI